MRREYFFKYRICASQVAFIALKKFAKNHRASGKRKVEAGESPKILY